MRDRAARLLGALCRRFGDPFYNVQPRVSRTLLRALLDASMPLTTHYGQLPCLQLQIVCCASRLSTQHKGWTSAATKQGPSALNVLRALCL